MTDIVEMLQKTVNLEFGTYDVRDDSVRIGRGHLHQAIAEIQKLRGQVMAADARLLESKPPVSWWEIAPIFVWQTDDQKVEWPMASPVYTQTRGRFPPGAEIGNLPPMKCTERKTEPVAPLSGKFVHAPLPKPTEPPKSEPWGSAFAMNTENWK